MKSLLISDRYFLPQTGGISNIMASIARCLGPKHVCCLTGARGRSDLANFDQECNVYRSPMAFGPSRILQTMALSAAIARIFAAERPKVVQLATVGEGYLGLLLERWFGLPFVIYAHGNEIMALLGEKRPTWDKPLKALRKAAAVIANSQFTAGLLEKAGVELGRISIVSPGCDTEFYRPLAPDIKLKKELLGVRWQDQVILTVGNLVERKGHDMVIRAVARLRAKRDNLSYLIVGDGRDRPALERLAIDLSVDNLVVFAGRIDTKQLPQIYSICDVFAMPSRLRQGYSDVEGFGLVFLEANACGKAVIGGRSGGIPDAIVDGATGLLVDPEDEDSLVSAFTHILDNEVLASRMGKVGRERVLSHYTWAMVASRISGVLQDCIDRRAS